MKLVNYTEEQFIEAVKNSVSIREALIKLGLKPSGGNYRTAHNTIKKLNLDTSHHGRYINIKKIKKVSKRPLEDYLLNKAKILSNTLKKRLINEGVFEHKCNSCLLTHWKNELIPLELHHINGNHLDNSLSNLQILCPNCHAQKHQTKIVKNKQCIDCDKTIISKSVRCRSCSAKLYKNKISKRPSEDILSKDLELMGCTDIAAKYNVSIHTIYKWLEFYKLKSHINKSKQVRNNYPSNEELSIMVFSEPIINIAKKIGVSDSGLLKYCKRQGIKTPKRGYWTKQKFNKN